MFQATDSILELRAYVEDTTYDNSARLPIYPGKSNVQHAQKITVYHQHDMGGVKK
jgi:hypothetical protein